MTDPDLTAIAIILDRSGSMLSIRDATQETLDAFIETQRNEPGKALFTLAQFDNDYELVYDLVPIADVGHIELVPRSATALLDAMGRTIVTLGERLAALDEDRRPGKVIVAVVTDGYENASREWTKDRVFELVKQQQDQWNWEFLYLSADADAVKDAGAYGIQRDHVHSYIADCHGVAAAASAMTQTVSTYRGGGKATIDPGGGE